MRYGQEEKRSYFALLLTCPFILKDAHHVLDAMLRQTSQKMPVNRNANRTLDCAVIKSVHETNKRKGLPEYDTIKSAFIEGDPIYPTSNFTERLHVEICVLKTDSIKGYFLPRPLEDLIPT